MQFEIWRAKSKAIGRIYITVAGASADKQRAVVEESFPAAALVFKKDLVPIEDTQELLRQIREYVRQVVETDDDQARRGGELLADIRPRLNPPRTRLRDLQWQFARTLHGFDSLVLGYGKPKFTAFVTKIWPKGYSHEAPDWSVW